VIDPDLDVVRIYRNLEGRFEGPEELRAGRQDVLTTAHLDGLELPVAKIFAD
jgi:hypothetical protein